MEWFVVTPPAETVVSLAQAHAWLRNYSGSTHDDLTVSLAIQSATDLVEAIAGRAFVSRTLRYEIDTWPCGRVIDLLTPPIVSVTSVQYVDENRATQTLSAGDYDVALGQDDPGRVVLRDGKSWPMLATRYPHAVKVTYVAGYGAASAVPASCKNAVLAAVEHVVDRRGLPDDPGLTATIRKSLGPYWRARCA